MYCDEELTIFTKSKIVILIIAFYWGSVCEYSKSVGSGTFEPWWCRSAPTPTLLVAMHVRFSGKSWWPSWVS